MEQTSIKTTPRDFFLYLLAIVTLYFSIWRFIDMIFSYINVLLPDPLEYSYNAAQNVRWSMAVLIVLFPVYLGVTWFLRKDVIQNPEKRELKVRKCLLNLTLFLAAMTIITDLVTLINNFLNGELTLRFFLKVFTVFAVAGSVFGYYFWDLRRETRPESRPSKWIAGLAALVVFGSIVSGFFIIGSPATQRKMRFDNERVNHLSMIQGQIVEYWRQKGRLPVGLSDLKDDISGFMPPVDPKGSTAYEYRVLSDLSFELCANFELASQKTKQGYEPYPVRPYLGDPYSSNWDHEAGRGCFSRNIDPDIYTPAPGKFKN